jgi:hypothetical protein
MRLLNADLFSAWNAIPLERRIAILTLSIIEREPHATDAVRNLIATASLMAEQLDEVQRAVFATLLRETADLLDRPRVLN